MFAASFLVTASVPVDAAILVPDCDCRIHNDPDHSYGVYDIWGECQPDPCATPIDTEQQ